jgi:hypothetical protein
MLFVFNMLRGAFDTFSGTRCGTEKIGMLNRVKMGDGSHQKSGDTVATEIQYMFFFNETGGGKPLLVID